MFKYKKTKYITDKITDEEWQEVLKRYKWHLEQEGYRILDVPTIPKYVEDYINWSKSKGRSLMGLLAYYESNYPDKSTELEFFMMNSDTQEKITLAYILDEWKIEKENYYARIIGFDLLDGEDGYWNVQDGELSIDNSWHDEIGHKSTLLTKEMWNELGITKKNAIFVNEMEGSNE